MNKMGIYVMCVDVIEDEEVCWWLVVADKCIGDDDGVKAFLKV